MTAKQKWMLFDCPFCQKQMEIIRQRAGYHESEHTVDTSYRCDCGYKQKTEVPRALAATIVDEATCLPSPVNVA